MNAKFANWTNQYIDLITTKPRYVIAGGSDVLSSQDLSDLRRRMEGHDALFVELGCGAGGHLVKQAEKRPGGFFVGFELRFKRTFRAAEKAEKVALENFLVLRSDARTLPRLFAPGSIDGIYVNFPDPWSDKRKWAKHRILKPPFLAEIEKLLKPGGFLSYKTDHAFCFNETRKLIEQTPGLSIEKCSEDLYLSPFAAENVASEFEKLFFNKGMKIFFLEARKSP